jgi:peptide/nickel transport system ATP-binding protein
MYGGRIVEVGPVAELLGTPSHPYTKALIGAIARIVGDSGLARPLPGRPPDLTTIPKTGCVFRDRCAFAMEVCAVDEPALLESAPGRRRACHAPAEVVAVGAAVPGPAGDENGEVA